MESIFGVLPFLVFIVFLWFTYVNASYIVTVFRMKRKDRTLTSCLSRTGTIFYLVLSIIYYIAFIGSIVYMIVSLLNDDMGVLEIILNGITIFSLIYVYILQQIIFVGHRQILIGKIVLDYRKIKRVTFPKSTKLNFVYGQKTYQTSLWFIDEFKLKKALQKSR